MNKTLLTDTVGHDTGGLTTAALGLVTNAGAEVEGSFCLYKHPVEYIYNYNCWCLIYKRGYVYDIKIWQTSLHAFTEEMQVMPLLTETMEHGGKGLATAVLRLNWEGLVSVKAFML